MILISQAELNAIVDHSDIKQLHIAATESGKWVAVFHIKRLSGRIEEYRLLSQRGTPREWVDARTLLRFLKSNYKVTAGTFSTEKLPL